MKGRKPHSLDYMPLISQSEVYHYTCNPPSHDFLEKNKISPVGDKFGCSDSREVLKISRDFLEAEGISFEDKNTLVLGIENYFARL